MLVLWEVRTESGSRQGTTIPLLTQAESCMHPTCPAVRAVIEQTQRLPRCGYAAYSEAAGRPAARVEANLQGAMLLRWNAVPGHELARTPRWR